MRISDWISDVCSSDLLGAFQPLLMARAELTTRLAQSMFWWAGPETRKDILTRHSIERRMMYAALDGVLEPGLAAAATDDALRVNLSRDRKSTSLNSSH